MTVPPRDINVTYYYPSAKVQINIDTTKLFYFNLDLNAIVNQILNINQFRLPKKKVEIVYVNN